MLDWISFLLEQLYELNKIGYIKARETFVKNIESVLWLCNNTDPIDEYIKKFSNVEYFSEAYHKLKDILEYNRLGWQLTAPQMFQRIKDLELYLEPSPDDIDSLLQSYVYIDDYISYLDEDSSQGSRYIVAGFQNYETLINFIADELHAIEDLSPFLRELLSSNNTELETVGLKVMDKYASLNDFLNDLDTIRGVKIKEIPLKLPYFLLGCIKRIKENSHNNYKRAIDHILNIEELRFSVPWLMVHSSIQDKDFKYLCDTIDNNERLYCDPLKIIAYRKIDKSMSNYNYEKVLDCLIRNDYMSDFRTCLYLELNHSSTIAEKYMPTLLDNIGIQTHEIFRKQDKLFKAIFLSEYGRKNIFRVVYDEVKQMRFISVEENSNLYKAFKALIAEDSRSFIDKFLKDDFLEVRISKVNGLSKILSNANSNEVLEWIGNAQERIEYWANKSRFHETLKNDNGSKTFSWNSIVIDLLKRATNPSKITHSIFENSILKIRGWSDSCSQEMKNRLSSLDLFEDFLKENNLQSHVQYVESERIKWLEAIRVQENLEMERKGMERGFDY